MASIYQEIAITAAHKDWRVHVTPIGNYESIKINGLFRPDILHNDIKVEHISPYVVFEATKVRYRPTAEKDSETYFGNMKNDTFKQWIKDPTVIDNAIGFILTDLSLLKYAFDMYGFGKFPSVEENIPFTKLKTILILSSMPPFINELNYDYILIVENGEITKLLELKETQGNV